MINLSKNDLIILRSAISYKIDNDIELSPLDVEGLKELSSLLYFFILQSNSN